MYEDRTYSKILEDARRDIGDEVIKSEGSLVHNALSALAYEIEKLYIQLDYVVEQSHAKTADLAHLEMIAADRAITRKKATNAYVKGIFNVVVPIGSRFSLKGYNYVVTEVINESLHEYTLMVEETGAGANTLRGDLIPINFVDGLETAKITELLVAGDNEESRESLYKRYIQSFTSQSFAGNIAAYKEKLESYQGVEGAKIYPVWNGPGTVKAVLISSEYVAVSSYLIERIKKDAVPEKGAGYGWVPIGHDLTIESVKEITIDVKTRITYAAGYSNATLLDSIKAKVQGYLKNIAKNWKERDENTGLTVYISRLESAILDVQGVLDVSSTSLNSSGSNFILKTNEIPKMGEVKLL